MRPDRIIVGEVRGGEALDMLQAMNTGHDGSLGTLHANTPRDALSRLETMVLMAGLELPIRAIHEQIATRHRPHRPHQSPARRLPTRHEGRRDRGHGGAGITPQDIFEFDHGAGLDEDGRHTGRLVPTGIRPAFADRLKAQGLAIPARLLGAADPVRSLRAR